MTITMSAKNQITIPKKLAQQLDLSAGAMFDIRINGNHLELIPLETVEKVFSDKEYAAMEGIFQKEKSSARRVTDKYIESL